MTFPEINPASLADGVYEGECDVNFIYAKVQLTIKVGYMQDIMLLKHNHHRGAAAKVIPDQIVAAQSLNPDGIAGATNSNKVIKKAMKNALTKWAKGAKPLPTSIIFLS